MTVANRVARFAPCFALAALGLLLFGSTGRDDAYITYWPARVLADDGEIVNYAGERLEQSSSLLHTIVLAAASKVTGFSVPAWGWAIGVAGGVLTAGLAVVVADRVRPGAGWRAGAFVATSGYLVYWSFGGLETSLAAATFLLALLGLAGLHRGRSAAWASAAAVVPYVLVRPEAPVVLAVVVAGAVALTRDRRGAVRMAVAVGAAAIAVAAFRLAYFGDVVPRPVRTKATGLRIGTGLEYLWDWLVAPAAVGVAVAAVAAAVAVRRRRAPATSLELLLASGAGAQLAFVVATGGDWMEAGRFVVAFLVVVAVLAAVHVHDLRWRTPLTLAVLGLQVLGVAAVARTESTGRPAWSDFDDELPVAVPDGLPWYESANRVHVRDAAFVPALVDVIDRLHETLGRPVVVASGQAGMAMYYVFERLPDSVVFVDRGRLTGDAFADCKEGLVSSEFGEVMTYEYWFSHTTECGTDLPDVIFELGTLDALGLGESYVLVHQQPAATLLAPEPLPGSPVATAEFIAVRADLAPR